MLQEKSIKRNVVYNVFKSFVSLVFPIVTFAYASRILRADGIGQVNYANSIVSYFLLIATLGINNYGIREAAKVREDKNRFSKIVHELIIINLISTMISYVLLIICVFFVEKFYDYKLLIFVCSIKIFFSSMGMEYVYSAMEEYEYITKRSLLMQFVALISLFLFVRSENDIIPYACVLMVSAIGSNIFNFLNIRKYVYFKKYRHYNLARHIKPICVLFAVNFAIDLYTNMDSTMLGYMSGVESVGYYTAAVKMNKLIVNIINAASVVIMPRLSYYSEKNEWNKFNELVKSVSNFILLMSCFFFVYFFAFSKNIIIIFSGDGYLPAVGASKILAFLPLIVPFSTLLTSQIFIPLRKENYMFICTSVSAIVNIVCNYFLINKFDIYGAAAATVIAEITCLTIALILSRSLVKIKSSFRYLWQYVLCSFVVLIESYFVASLIKNDFISAFVGGVIGVSVYIGLLVLFRNPYVMQLVKNIMRRS